MPALTQSQEQEEQELHFLTDWSAERDPGRWRKSAVGSLLAHAVVVALIVVLPRDIWFPAPVNLTVHQRITPLVEPPLEARLTQPTPNKGKINETFNAESLQPRPRVQIPPPAPPSTTRPAAPVPAPVLPLAPPIETAQTLPPAPKLAPEPAPPAPQIQVEEKKDKPKLVFETPGATSPVEGKGLGRIAVPSASVTEAVRNMATGRGPQGGLVVGDLGTGSGGIGEAINQLPTPGRSGSALELLSDPLGVDFRPYLIRVLANVRRNWFAILPESVKLGRRGRVAIQFAIDREGRVPKLVIVVPSGADPLDRAAVAGISASTPFPPLPSEYRGNQIRLQFTFSYNMPAK
ncbi:MAG: TonB C-terminal domain-containing protein [Candidatus Solibacter usitatus]|nr:TonB C-terminal domain-containing protein [Candidatus Solibacter usitatus]